MPRTRDAIRVFFLILALVSCAAPQRPAVTQPAIAMAWSVPPVEAVPDEAGQVREQAMPEGKSAIDIRIQWPGQHIQLLPGSVSRVSLTVSRGGTQLAALSIQRLQGASQATGSIEHLSSGAVTLAASARDSNDLEIANGSTDLTLLSNKRMPATLVMTPTNGPVITDFSPKAGGPGTLVKVIGNNFSMDLLKTSMTLGGVAIPVTSTFALSATEVGFRVPSGATTSAISIGVDGVTATSSGQFTTVGGFSLSPSVPQVVSKPGTVSFTVTALDTANPPAPVNGAEVYWYIDHVTGVNTVPVPTPAPTPTPVPTPTAPPTPTPDPSAIVPPPQPTTAVSAPSATGSAAAVGQGYTPPLGTFEVTSGKTGSAGQLTTLFTSGATGSGWINFYLGDLKATESIQVQ